MGDYKYRLLADVVNTSSLCEMECLKWLVILLLRVEYQNVQ